MSSTPGVASDSRGAVRALLAAVFIAFLAQMTLNPIIAPLAREVGLAEWQIGATISCAAVMVVITSPLWGRKSQSLGRKRVLLAAFTIALIAMTLFAGVSALGIAGAISSVLLFICFLSFRGIGFGTAIAAIMPTAQAFISDITPDEKSRVRGMAGLGAAQGMAMIAGAALGGLLGAFGLMVPLIAVPILLLVGLGLVATRLRQPPKSELLAHPAKVSPLDARVWPYLAAGFGIFTALGCIQVITGFIIQDRFGLDSEATAGFTGVALFVAGAGMLLAQGLIVPKTGWSPSTLLRVGVPINCLGFAAMAIDAGIVVFIVAMLVIGLGFGIAVPGYTAGPTLLVRREEQGALAGLIGATNGLTFVVAPFLSTWAYGVWPPLPVLAGGAVLVIVAIFTLVHPRFRQAGTAAAGPESQSADQG